MAVESVNVLVFEVGEGPCVMEIGEDERGSFLPDLQRIVGGAIEHLNLLEGQPELYVNDEGAINGLPPNRAVTVTSEMERAGCVSQIDGGLARKGELYTILFGPIVAVSYTEDDELRDITAEEIEKAKKVIGAPYSGLAEYLRLREEYEKEAQTGC